MVGHQDRALLAKHLRLALRHVGGALWRAQQLGDHGSVADLEGLYTELARVAEGHQEARRPLRGQTSFLN